MSTIATLIAASLATLWFLGALRMRTRARALQTLPPSDQPVSEHHVFITRLGVVLDEATKRAASSFALAQGLEVLDLISPRLSSWRTVQLLRKVDIASFRADRVATGYSAGDALLVDRRVLARLRDRERQPLAVDAFLRVARSLKRHAVTSTDVALAPALESPPFTSREQRRIIRVLDGKTTIVIASLLQLGLIALTLAWAPLWSALALLVLHAQLFLAGGPISPPDRARYTLFRTLIDMLSVFGPVAADTTPRPSERELRETYASLLAGGTERFFEPERSDCPLCGSTQLSRMLESGDPLQSKPGRFQLARCAACDHIFQNPRLSIEGLDFYYRDAYDGLGGQMFDDLFALQARHFEQRVAMVTAISEPRAWLDVGAGHGHFCCYARGKLPNTRFDGLDLNEGIEEAQRRRWIERALRGLFPSLAPELAGAETQYDVISMSHYLEHTLDPKAELDAAALVLRDGGLLMIEVPDPDSRIGRFFKSLWLPWMQPQHIHFVSAHNLDTLLRERSFEPLVWHRGAAHMPHDFLFITFFAIERIARPGDLPWLTPNGPLRKLWRGLVWTALSPLIAIAWTLDQLLQPLQRRAGWSNTYRVLARRRAASAAVPAQALSV